MSLCQEKQFSLCDFGSAGGTFVRLASGVPTPLYPSMMIMLGKHQVWYRVFHLVSFTCSLVYLFTLIGCRRETGTILFYSILLYRCSSHPGTLNSQPTCTAAILRVFTCGDVDGLFIWF